MSAPATTLEFRLPGRWIQLDPRHKEASLAEIKAFVARVGTRRDDAAKARAILSENLRATLEQAEASNFQTIFICEEIADGVPFPVTITVYEPELRMSPAVGTSPEAVIGTLRKALVELGVPGVEDAMEIDLEDSKALRITRHQLTRMPRDLDEIDDTVAGASGGDTVDHPTLAVDYWYTRPETKRFVVASFFTPVADAPHVVADFFDNVVRASRVVVPDPA